MRAALCGPMWLRYAGSRAYIPTQADRWELEGGGPGWPRLSEAPAPRHPVAMGPARAQDVTPAPSHATRGLWDSVGQRPHNARTRVYTARMPKQRVDMRLDERVLRDADAYGESRGWSRTMVVQEALRSFLQDAKGGVPELEEAAGEGLEPHPATRGDTERVRFPQVASPPPRAPVARRVVPEPEKQFCPWGCGRVRAGGKSYCDGCGRDYESGEDVLAEFRPKGRQR